MTKDGTHLPLRGKKVSDGKYYDRYSAPEKSMANTPEIVFRELSHEEEKGGAFGPQPARQRLSLEQEHSPPATAETGSIWGLGEPVSEPALIPFK